MYNGHFGLLRAPVIYLRLTAYNNNNNNNNKQTFQNAQLTD